MNAHEHTDPHGDGLTITHDDGKMWITCTTAHAEVTVGPLAAGILADHDMDGGVAAALIEKEAEQPTAEVRELRSALASEVARGNALQDALDAAKPRPLTPDAITEEMVEQALASFEKDRPGIHHFPWMIRNALTAALTERIARALFEKYETDITWDATLDFPAMRSWYLDAAPAVLPIVAEEVRKAKAGALRDAAGAVDLDKVAEEWSQGPGNRNDMHWAAANAASSVVATLHDLATEHEAGDQR